MGSCSRCLSCMFWAFFLSGFLFSGFMYTVNIFIIILICLSASCELSLFDPLDIMINKDKFIRCICSYFM